MTTPSETPPVNLSPDEVAINKLLAELNSDEADRRKAAVEALAQLKTSNAQVMSALKSVATNDSDEFVRQAAGLALIFLSSLPASTPDPPLYKRWDFWLGFVGWYVVNWLVYEVIGWQTLGMGRYSVFLGVFMLPLNLVVLLITTFTRRNLAAGLVVAFSTNLVVSAGLGAFQDALCGYPVSLIGLYR